MIGRAVTLDGERYEIAAVMPQGFEFPIRAATAVDLWLPIERFNPALAAVSADVRDPKFIEATRTSGYTFRSTDIGVVLDVMIHDLDIVLALARSTVVDVQAMGISVLGGQEDLATARLTFASGCVAQLSASRVSFQQQRTMTVFTARGSASLNFATHEATVVRPCEEVLRRELRLEQLSSDDRAYWKEHLFDKLLVRRVHQASPGNAIQEEQRDFVRAVRDGRTPRVDGAAGRDAVAVAEMILEQIEEHAWDGTPAGRHGPLAMPALPIVAGSTAPAIEHPTTNNRFAYAPAIALGALVAALGF